MREKDLKKLIKQQIESHIPEHAPSIDFEFKKEEPKFKKSWYKILNFQLVLSSVFILALGVIVYGLLNSEQVPTVQAYQFNSDEEVISFSALSTTAMLNTINTEQLSVNNTTRLSTITFQNYLIDTIEPYLDLAEKFLNEDSIIVEVSESELPEYTSKITFQMLDIIGKPSTYIMHYNMILVDEDDDESEYEINGILLYGIHTYTVYGEKEIEDDEESFKFKAAIDSNNYVESSYELDVEDQEKKFKFKQVENGILISESEIKVEVENNKNKFEIEFKEGHNEGEFEFKYRTIDGQEVINIEFDAFIDLVRIEGEITVQVVIDAITGISSYRIMVKSS
ncbi:MAG: hypothetical protein RBT45_04575, partial [Acholeplasmataceae bacterium]|nr:hypothetical protein [Acholeplasmataceae bacterium]